jgi:hypothetical protein
VKDAGEARSISLSGYAYRFEVAVNSTFILYIKDGVITIVFQHEHEDFWLALRRRGVPLATSGDVERQSGTLTSRAHELRVQAALGGHSTRRDLRDHAGGSPDRDNGDPAPCL